MSYQTRNELLDQLARLQSELHSLEDRVREAVALIESGRAYRGVTALRGGVTCEAAPWDFHAPENRRPRTQAAPHRPAQPPDGGQAA